MTKRVTVIQAAKEIGMAPQGLRVHMQKGLIDIGYVLPSISGKGDKNRYFIFRDKLDKYLGKTEEQRILGSSTGREEGLC